VTSLTPFAAPCVRACALRSGLLRPHEWHALMEMGSADTVITWLQARGVLPAEATAIPAAERSAHQTVIQSSSALLRFARGDLGDLLQFFLTYYDLMNLESVIHRLHGTVEGGTSHGRPFETGPLGLLDASIGDVSNFAALARLLKRTLFAPPFEAALQRYNEDEDVSRMVESIEVAFFAGWIAAAKRCGFRLNGGTDGSGLAVFLVECVSEAAVRLKLHRDAETSRIVEWLSLVTEGRPLDACLSVLSEGGDNGAVLKLAAILFSKRLVPGASQEPTGSLAALSLLRVMVLRQAIKANRGITFNADFLTSLLVLQRFQALELTLLLESKDAGITDVTSAYGEIAA